MRKIQGKTTGKILICVLCAWMTAAMPVTAMAEASAELPMETVSAPSAETPPVTPPEIPPETTPEIPTDAEIPDEDRDLQFSSDTLSVEEYELFRPESFSNILDTLYKGRSARLSVTVLSGSLQTGDLKASEIIVSKERDSYRTTGSPVVKVISKKGENLGFKVIFPKITYNGQDTNFGFQIKYKGVNMEAISLSADITEAEESGSSDSGRDNGEEEAGPQPVVKVERAGSPQPVGAGEKTELKVNLQAGQDLSGASQSLDVELKYNYYSANRITSGTSIQKVMIPVKGNSASGQPLIRISRTG